MVKNGCSAVSPALVDVPERTIASGLTFVIARAVLTLLHSTVPSDGIGEMSHRCRVLASPHGSGLATLDSALAERYGYRPSPLGWFRILGSQVEAAENKFDLLSFLIPSC